MEAFKALDAMRRQEPNPFREMLQRMGAFGGPTLGDIAGVQKTPPAPQQPAPNLEQLVAALVAKGMPEEEALAQAQQLMARR